MIKEIRNKIDENKEEKDNNEQQVLTGKNKTDFLRKQLLLRNISENTSKSTSTDDEYKIRVNDILEGEINRYYKYISDSMDFYEAVQEFPSKQFKEGKIKLEKELIEETRNPLYTAKLFDVFAWWRSYGEKKWPHVAIAALLMFAKPMDNNFKERVFSTKENVGENLYVNMNKETFENEFLESMNCDKTEYYLNQWKREDDEAARIKYNAT